MVNRRGGTRCRRAMAVTRHPHPLKANKRNSRPRYMVFFDTETEPIKIDENTIEQRLKLGVACLYRRGEGKRGDKKTWITFQEPSQFWWRLDDIKAVKGRIAVVSHNLDFDFMVLGGFKPLTDMGYKLLHFITNQAVNIWKFRKGRKTLLFLDNMNYFKMSLKALGDAVGLPKLKIDFDTCTQEELEIYCKRDVEIMVKAWQDWHQYCKDNDLGVWATTVTGQAFNAYRHRFMDTAPYIHTNKPCVDLERRAYHGGRSECFKIGEYGHGPYYMLDVNSMYPYVMAQERYPYMLKTFLNKGDIAILKKYTTGFGMIADVIIDTPEPAYPVKYNNHLIFPTGRFATTLTTPEIKYALMNQHIKEVGLTAIYAMTDLFSRYVRYFYSQRMKFQEQGNTVYALIAKLMLNSLYGKFGQKIDIWETVGEDGTMSDQAWREWDAGDHTMRSFRCIGGVIEEVTGHDEGFNAFPAICAHVTAYARLYLWDIINTAGRGHVYYCDTDSVIVDAAGYSRLLSFHDPKKIGMIKVDTESDTLSIYNVKQYTFGSKRRCKGIKADAIEVSPAVYKQWHQVHINGALKDRTSDRCTWKQIIKHIDTTYKKGVVLPGGDVVPFHLPVD